MTETFEERLTSRLDGLYAGALFLAGGDEPVAEGLLVEAVRQAFRVFRRARPAGDPDAWFDARLVDAFRRTWGDTPDPVGPAKPEEGGDVGDVHRRPVAARTRSGVGRPGKVRGEVDWSTIADAAARILARELGMPLDPLRVEGFEIARAEICLVDGLRGAMVLYRDGSDRTLSHYMVPRPQAGSRALARVTGETPVASSDVASPTVVTWSDGEMEQALVGEVDARALVAFARSGRRRARER